MSNLSRSIIFNCFQMHNFRYIYIYAGALATSFTTSIKGDESEAPTRRLSQIQTHLVARVPSATPPPKPPRTDLAVLSSLKKKREREKQKELANDKTADTQNEQKKSLEVSSPTSFATKGTTEEDSKTSIVRSVSEYRADELVTDVRQKFTKSNTTAIFDVSPSVTKGMDELDEALRFVEDNSLSEMMVELSDKAPLVQLQEICSCISADVENSFGNGCEASFIFLSYPIYCAPTNHSKIFHNSEISF
uniref:Transmembrane protein n=1 Tax=Parascaris univalens TaxID=6257 RepID=A0A915C2L6_PARUN